MQPLSWAAARQAAHTAGLAARPAPVDVPLAEADGLTLAAPLAPLTDLPAFPTSSVDGYAVRGPGPWRVAGRALAGSVPEPLSGATAVEIATGAMLPEGTEQLIRTEESQRDEAGRITGRARSVPDWRDRGDEARAGEQLLPAGTPVTPAVIGLAASCGHDTLAVTPAPRAAVVIFGDELLTAGPPGLGRVRDALGPQLPAWLARLGAVAAIGERDTTAPGPIGYRGPVADTLEAHVDAIRAAVEVADVVATTGGTMHGPVDHLHPALAKLAATYLADSVAVRPGFPMLLAQIPRAGRPPAFIAGLPGNPQSAVVALVSLVVPLLLGLAGAPLPDLPRVRLAGAVKGRGEATHLALVRLDSSGLAEPLGHAGSAMLRGLARADGFAVVAPRTDASSGDEVPFVALPLLPGGRP
ncbi:MAG TPA: molybdopterin-binding protein [Micromonosporaceae bacterium]|jgi:molybdopterin molybdotransferase